MNGADIKNVIEKLVPDKEMEHRISEKIVKKQHNKFPFKQIASIAASLVIVISLGILGNNFLTGTQKSTGSSNSNGLSSNSNSNGSTDGSSSLASVEGIFIPEIELPKDTNAILDMIGLIVYQGRVYTQTGTKISAESAEKLLGDKLGTTKGNISEWSKQKEYAVEFASSIGPSDVYSVKGYDKSFRIMTYEKIDGTIYAEFFECFNRIVVKTGADLFDKLKIENNIKAAKHEKFESWNNNQQQYKEITNLKALNSFVSELKNTIPYSQKSLSYLFQKEGEGNRKIVYITLNDGTEVQLILFKDGYIYYSSSHIFFKMENSAFNKLLNELK
jgi:hypothetical protein